MAKVSASSSVTSILRAHPPFRRVWLGLLVSTLGDQLTWLALTWLVLEVTQSGSAVGLTLLCFALPAVVTGPLIGRLLDRVQPRTIMLVDNLSRAGISALIPTLALLNLLSLPVIFGLAACAGALAPATKVGARILVPKMLADADLAIGNTALALTWQLPTVLGPALAGLLIAQVGAANALWLDALSFLVMAWAVLAIPDVAGYTGAGHAVPRLGVTQLRALPGFVVVLALTAMILLSYGPMESALIVFARERLQTDAQGYGLLWSVTGVGIVLGGLTAGWLARRLRAGVLLGAIAVAWGAAQALVASAPSLPVALVWMFIGGVAWGPYAALETSLLQRIVPKAQHGAAFGVRAAIMTPTSPLGTAVGGALLSVTTADWVIAVSGLMCVAGGVVALLIRELRNAGGDYTDTNSNSGSSA